MFIAILILVTLSIAGSAAFFSVYGLAQIFTGSFWPVVIMASALEAGKLVAASYVYRYWDHISIALKAYLLSAILVLMFITSIGIFGFLSAAYQQDILPLEEMQTKIELLDLKIADLEKIRSEERLNMQITRDNKAKEIAALPANYATKKKEVSERYEARIIRIEDTIASYTLQIRSAAEEKQELQMSTLQQELKTGPIIFIAEAFGREVNDATKWLILIIIFAFDPLAVALTVGANIAIVERQTHKRRREDDRVEMLDNAMGVEDFDEPEPSVTSVDQIDFGVDDLPDEEDIDIPTDDVISEPIIEDIIEEVEPIPEPVDHIAVDEIQKAIEELSNKALTPAEEARKVMLGEMLRRKEVTENIRNPKRKS
jgi:hypothetical protein